MTIYEQNGYEDRKAYLQSLSEEYPPTVVQALADALGPNEDFDGLVTALEDADEFGDLGDWDF